MKGEPDLRAHTYAPTESGRCFQCGELPEQCVGYVRPAPRAEDIKPPPAPSSGRHRASAQWDGADPVPTEPWSELGYARASSASTATSSGTWQPGTNAADWSGTGKRWAHDTTGQRARWMKSIARRNTSDALAIPDERERRAAVNLARRGEFAAGIAGALTLAGTEQGIVVTRTTWMPNRSC